MPLISTKKKDYEPEDRDFSGHRLNAGTYVCVMLPWPPEIIPHKHPFKKDDHGVPIPTYSWPVRFEHCSSDGVQGRTVTLWVESEPDGQIKATDLGEGRFNWIREALQLPEIEEFDTAAMEWAIVKVVVGSKIVDSTTGEFKSWVKTVVRASKEEQVLANDYLARIHPEVE